MNKTLLLKYDCKWHPKQAKRFPKKRNKSSQNPTIYCI